MADLSNKPFLQQLRKILSDGIQRIDNDECDESKAVGMIARFNVESDEYYGKKRFVNYDKAMNITGIRSRGMFKQICDSNNIKEKTIGHIKIGFLRSEIEDLAERIRNENHTIQKKNYL